MKSETHFLMTDFLYSHNVGNTDGYAVWYMYSLFDIDMNKSSNLEIVPLEMKLEVVEDRGQNMWCNATG